METVIWVIIMVPLAVFFTGIGIFAWRRKKPMWFWSGSEVKDWEITDVKAYNRANGIMWICFSVVYWIGLFSGLLNREAAGAVVAAGTLLGIPVLVIAYNKIYSKYHI